MREESNSLREEVMVCMGSFRKGYWFFLLAMAIGLFLGVAVINIFPQKNTYQSMSTVVGIKYGDSTNSAKTNSGSTVSTMDYTETVVFYGELVKSLDLCSKVADILDYENVNASTIQGMISVDNESSDVVLSITATSESSKLAIDVANTMADVYAAEVNEILGDDGAKVLDKSGSASIKYSKRVMEAAIVLLFVVASALIEVVIVVVTAKRNLYR